MIVVSLIRCGQFGLFPFFPDQIRFCSIREAMLQLLLLFIFIFIIVNKEENTQSLKPSIFLSVSPCCIHLIVRVSNSCVGQRNKVAQNLSTVQCAAKHIYNNHKMCQFSKSWHKATQQTCQKCEPTQTVCLVEDILSTVGPHNTCTYG